jgi:hypothetical protein
MDLSLTLNLDQPQLSLRRVRSLTERLIVAMDALTGGATYSLEIRPILDVDGVVGPATEHTATGNKPRLVLKVRGPVGDIELARLDPADFTVIVEETVNVGWSATLALTSAALRAFFADGAQMKFAILEITNVFASGYLKPLYLTNAQILAGYLATDAEATSDDADGTKLKVMGTVTSHAEMRALSTTGYAKPKKFHFLINSQWEEWTWRTKAGSGEDDDDTSYIQTTDYHATTNNGIFVKTATA